MKKNKKKEKKRRIERVVLFWTGCFERNENKMDFWVGSFAVVVLSSKLQCETWEFLIISGKLYVTKVLGGFKGMSAM